jgi:nucleotide-binding universal stress UspA family protein
MSHPFGWEARLGDADRRRGLPRHVDGGGDAHRVDIAVALESEAEAQAIVEHAWQELHDSGVKAHYEVQNTLHGQAGPAIVDAAIAHDAGVIVVGSRGRSDLAGLVLGSTAHKVIHLSDRPVLVVR